MKPQGDRYLMIVCVRDMNGAKHTQDWYACKDERDAQHMLFHLVMTAKPMDHYRLEWREV